MALTMSVTPTPLGIVRIFRYAGDPNGYVFAPSPAMCLDTVNRVTWWKLDGQQSNTGWEAA